MGEGRDSVVIKGQPRDPCGDETILYVDYGGGYLHNKNCIELSTCVHIHTNEYIVFMFISWL